MKNQFWKTKTAMRIDNIILFNILKYLHGTIYFKIKYFYHRIKVKNFENKKKFLILEKFFTK